MIDKNKDISQAEKLRFQTELEFIQLLGNFEYVKYLAKQGYFGEASFRNYLRYLNYWKTPEYAKFIEYPICLSVLELVQDDCFLDGLLFDFTLEKTNKVFTSMFENWFSSTVASENQKKEKSFLDDLLAENEDSTRD